MLPVLGGTPREAADLVSAGLWITAGDGWCFHDWNCYQPTRREVTERREKNAEKLRRWREKRDSNGGETGDERSA
jgi:hypothetical protein